MPSEIDWARLAAYIDGEGTIYINRQKPRKSTHSPRHFLCISVTNTNLPLISWIQNTFGGCVYDVRGNEFSKKPIKRWQLNASKAEAILRRCLPYFIAKRPQAEIGLAFCDLKKQGPKERGMRGLVLPGELARREDLAQQIKGLNSPKKGLTVAA